MNINKLKKLLIIMKKMILIASAFVISAQSLLAQEAKDMQAAKSNFIKLNLFSLALRNASFQYERILNKTIGLNLGVRYMPDVNISASLSKISFLEKKEVFAKNATLGNIAITPEARFYVGNKGYGHGFYVGAYYRYANFYVKNMEFELKSDQKVKKVANSNASVSSHSLGFVLGAQWILGKKKNIMLDWTILGVHYGINRGNMNANVNFNMTVEDQNDLKKTIDDIDLPFIEKTTTVNANGGNVKIKGPWAGLRSSFSIGIGF